MRQKLRFTYGKALDKLNSTMPPKEPEQIDPTQKLECLGFDRPKGFKAIDHRNRVVPVLE